MTAQASVQSAIHFLDSINLDAAGPTIRNYQFALAENAPVQLPVTDAAGLVGLKDSVEQAFIDNSGVLSFTPEVSVALREATVISCQLAGRVASKLYPDDKAEGYAENWATTYINTLTNIGWVVQQQTSFSKSEKVTKGNVGEQIVAIIKDVFSDKANLVERIIGLFKNMPKDGGLITLYRSRTVRAEAAQTTFQIASTTDKGFQLESIAFQVQAKTSDTTVLVFNWGRGEAEYSYRNVRLTLSETLWGMIKDKVLAKVAKYLAEDVQALPDI